MWLIVYWNVIDSLCKWSHSIDCQAHVFCFKTKNCSDDDLFISCSDRIGKMLHNICISAVAMLLRWASCGLWASCFIPCHTIMAGYYGLTLDASVSVLLSIRPCLPVLLSSIHLYFCFWMIAFNGFSPNLISQNQISDQTAQMCSTLTAL